MLKVLLKSLYNWVIKKLIDEDVFGLGADKKTQLDDQFEKQSRS